MTETAFIERKNERNNYSNRNWIWLQQDVYNATLVKLIQIYEFNNNNYIIKYKPLHVCLAHGQNLNQSPFLSCSRGCTYLFYRMVFLVQDPCIISWKRKTILCFKFDCLSSGQYCSVPWLLLSNFRGVFELRTCFGWSELL